MSKEEIFAVIAAQGVVIKPDISDSKVVLTVRGDSNDADYITENYDFEFSELQKVIEIADKLNSLPDHWEDNLEDEDDEENDIYEDLGNYIPSGENGFVHSIDFAHIDIFIEGQKYTFD